MAHYGRQTNEKDESLQWLFFKKKAAVLLCTNIAAWGLDFPSVHGLVQLDCSKDASTSAIEVQLDMKKMKRDSYSFFSFSWHFKRASGKEDWLQSRSIPRKLAKFRGCSFFFTQDQEIKHWVQCSFICYLWSIHLWSNKMTFQLPITKYANSFASKEVD